MSRGGLRPRKVAGVVLLAGGLLLAGLSFFGWTRRESHADLGPMKIRVEERTHLGLPAWVGLALAIAGAGLLLLPERR